MLSQSEIREALDGQTTHDIIAICTLSYYHQYLIQLRDPDVLDRFEELFERFKVYYSKDDAAAIIQYIERYDLKGPKTPFPYGDDEKEDYRIRLGRLKRSRDDIELKANQRALGITVDTKFGGRTYNFGGDA